MKPKRTDNLTELEKENLSSYFSDVDADVFVISNLNPEVVGAALARYSRAPTGLKETVVREFLNPDGTPNEVKGTELIDRVVNKYGDESVAELAVAPLCIENVSNLMTKIIEDCRIGGSPIEESTRYVLYDVKRNEQWRYVRPESIMQSELAGLYVQTMDFLFETYAGLVGPTQEFFRKKLPASDFQIEVERDGEVTLTGLNPNSVQGDAGFLNILEQMGCVIERSPEKIIIKGNPLSGININMNSMPDIVQTLAVTALFAKGETFISGISNLKIKETDRIGALVQELSRLGANIEAGEDYLKIRPGIYISADIETYDDHRMAMSLALAGLKVPGIRIKNPNCVEKSFPDFFDRFKAMYE